MSKTIITVAFFANQSAEDLFKDVDTGKVYLRQPCTDKTKVTWLSCTKWSGGYEADTPLPEYTLIRVVKAKPRKNEEQSAIFTEIMCKGTAVKLAPFTYEDTKNIAKQVSSQLDLHSHAEWKSWLTNQHPDKARILANAKRQNPECDWIFTADDNFLYCSDNVMLIKETPVEDVYCRRLYMREVFRKHRLCDAEWVCVEIVNQDTILELAGYRFDSNEGV